MQPPRPVVMGPCSRAQLRTRQGRRSNGFFPSCARGRRKRVGWAEPTGRANAHPMTRSAISIMVRTTAMGFAKRSTHPAICCPTGWFICPTGKSGDRFLDRLSSVRPFGWQNRLRANCDLLSQFNLIWAVQSSPAKIFSFPMPLDRWLFRAVPPRQEGRLAIVTGAGRDAVDAGGAQRRSVPEADGEVVWS
jgi:hypothetical protein